MDSSITTQEESDNITTATASVLDDFHSQQATDFDDLLDSLLRQDFDIEDISHLPHMNQKKKKKRKNSKRPSNNPVYMPGLRILRRDIRRKYGTMLNNVINSHDLSLMFRFFRQFAVPHVEVTDQVPVGCIIKLHRKVPMRGLEDIINNFAMNFIEMPDAILQLSEVKVCQRLNCKGSKIIANSRFKGTMTFCALPEDIIPATSSGSSSHEGNDDDQMEKSPPNWPLGVKRMQNNPLLNYQRIFHPRLDPFEYILDGTVTLTLDEEHRIVAVKIQKYSIEERYLQDRFI